MQIEDFAIHMQHNTFLWQSIAISCFTFKSTSNYSHDLKETYLEIIAKCRKIDSEKKNIKIIDMNFVKLRWIPERSHSHHLKEQVIKTG